MNSRDVPSPHGVPQNTMRNVAAKDHSHILYDIISIILHSTCGSSSSIYLFLYIKDPCCAWAPGGVHLGGQCHGGLWRIHRRPAGEGHGRPRAAADPTFPGSGGKRALGTGGVTRAGPKEPGEVADVADASGQQLT